MLNKTPGADFFPGKTKFGRNKIHSFPCMLIHWTFSGASFVRHIKLKPSYNNMVPSVHINNNQHLLSVKCCTYSLSFPINIPMSQVLLLLSFCEKLKQEEVM